MSHPIDVLVPRLDALGVAVHRPPDAPDRLVIYPGHDVVVLAVAPPGRIVARLFTVIAVDGKGEPHRMREMLLRQSACVGARIALADGGEVVAIVDLVGDFTDDELRVALHALINARRGWEHEAWDCLDAEAAPERPPEGVGAGNGAYAWDPVTLARTRPGPGIADVGELLPGWTQVSDDTLTHPDEPMSVRVDPDRAGVTVIHHVRDLDDVYDPRLGALLRVGGELPGCRLELDEWTGALQVMTDLTGDACTAVRLTEAVVRVEDCWAIVEEHLERILTPTPAPVVAPTDIPPGEYTDGDDVYRVRHLRGASKVSVAERFDGGTWRVVRRLPADRVRLAGPPPAEHYALDDVSVDRHFAFREWAVLLEAMREQLKGAVVAHFEDLDIETVFAHDAVDVQFNRDAIGCGIRAIELLAAVDEAIVDVRRRIEWYEERRPAG